MFTDRLTGYNNILVVTHQIFENGERSSLDIDITPVDPGVIRAQSGTEKPVSGLGHELSAASLGGETVTAFDILVNLLTKVLLNDGNLSIWLSRVLVILDRVHVVDQKLKRVIFGVGNQESEINQVVRVGKVAQVREEHGQMRRGIAERNTEKNALFSLPSSSSATDGVQVIVSHGF